MYSNQTYEVIKERILNDTNINVDKREGSFVNNMVSPIAIEFTRTYIEFNHILGIMFAKDSYGKWLDMKTEEWGVIRKLGVKAGGKVRFSGDDNTLIEKGTRVKTTNGLVYETSTNAIIENGYATVDCEAINVGSIYNISEGVINSLEFEVYGIKSVMNITDFLGGIDAETDDELKERFFEKIRTPAISGNAHQYKQWAMSVDGVKYAKVEPLHNGPGSVKVIITDDGNRPVLQSVINACKNYIESVRPIGASVTVITPISINIDIRCNVFTDETVNFEMILNDLREKVENYIVSCNDIIYISKISSIIGANNYIVDFNSLFINNSTENIIIAADSVASLNKFEINKAGVLL